MTPSRALRFAAAVAALAALACAGWVFGGHALARDRERAVANEWERTLGSYPALVRRYTFAATNASARRVEEIAKTIGFDLALRQDGGERSGPSLSKEEREALRDALEAELTREAGPVALPPPRLAAMLASRRDALFTFEELLSSGPPPRWSCDPTGDPEDWPHLPAGAHLLLQRLLVADALAFSSKGEESDAARALEASWALNQALLARPEVVSQMIATAIARYQAGALRRTGGSARVWATRLAGMGSRQRLVEALVLERGDVHESRVRLRRLVARQAGAWYTLTGPIQRVRERLFNAEYERLWLRTIAELRDSAPFADSADSSARPHGSAEVVLAVAIPGLRNAIQRADRVALDAELTGKILRIRDARRERGAWPAPSAEISSSRFPGLSWAYEVRDDTASLSLFRGAPLPDPYSKNSLVLPLSFSATSSQP